MRGISKNSETDILRNVDRFVLAGQARFYTALNGAGNAL